MSASTPFAGTTFTGGEPVPATWFWRLAATVRRWMGRPALPDPDHRLRDALLHGDLAAMTQALAMGAATEGKAWRERGIFLVLDIPTADGSCRSATRSAVEMAIHLGRTDLLSSLLDRGAIIVPRLGDPAINADEWDALTRACQKFPQWKSIHLERLRAMTEAAWVQRHLEAGTQSVSAQPRRLGRL